MIKHFLIFQYFFNLFAMPFLDGTNNQNTNIMSNGEKEKQNEQY
jgi:hypothetical protein